MANCWQKQSKETLPCHGYVGRAHLEHLNRAAQRAVPRAHPNGFNPLLPPSAISKHISSGVFCDAVSKASSLSFLAHLVKIDAPATPASTSGHALSLYSTNHQSDFRSKHGSHFPLLQLCSKPYSQRMARCSTRATRQLLSLPGTFAVHCGPSVS